MAQQSDYQSSFLFLLPTGPVWTKTPGSSLDLIAQGVSQSQARVDAEATLLQQELFPSTTDQLLSSWEASTGLPDACLGANPTVAQRVGQLVARLTNTGGQNQAFYIAYAAALGYQITIKTWSGAIVGRIRAGNFHTASSANVIYNWTVVVQGSYSAVLECEFRKLCAAHMQLWFVYTG